MIKKAEKRKRRAFDLFSESIKIFTESSILYKTNPAKSEELRIKARSLKAQSFKMIELANELIALAHCQMGLDVPNLKTSAEIELLEKKFNSIYVGK